MIDSKKNDLSIRWGILAKATWMATESDSERRRESDCTLDNQIYTTTTWQLVKEY